MSVDTSMIPGADWNNQVLSQLSNEEQLNPKFTSGDRVNFYSENAEKYDKDMAICAFR